MASLGWAGACPKGLEDQGKPCPEGGIFRRRRTSPTTMRAQGGPSPRRPVHALLSAIALILCWCRSPCQEYVSPRGELSPTRRSAVAPKPRRSRFLRAIAGASPSPCGGRARRFASPVRRHGEVSGASPVDGDRRRLECSRGPGPIKLLGAARSWPSSTPRREPSGAARSRERVQVFPSRKEPTQRLQELP